MAQSRCYLLLASALTTLATGCGEDESMIMPSDGSSAGDDSSSGGANTELYALATEIETPEGDVLYLDVVPDLSVPFDLRRDGIELLNTSTFQAIGEMVFAAPNDAPTITRYVLDENDELREDETLSFAGLGVTNAAYYSIISETKAYLYDYDTYKVHVWNPTAMTLSGVEIDLGAARHDDRGPLWLNPWRFDHIRRDNLLFMSGGWWPEDGPAPYSLVLVFDTDADTVNVLESDRCVNLGGTKKTENGDVFFFYQAYGIVINDIPPCGLVIRDGETDFDVDYNPDIAGMMGGRIPASFNEGAGDAVYAEVPYEELIEGDTLEDLLFFGGNGYRFWKVDLQTEEATEVSTLEFHAGARWTFPLGDGRRIMPVYSLIDPEDESAGYASDMYEILEAGELVPFEFGDDSDEVQARLSDIVRLR